jgi:hypothetical protein
MSELYNYTECDCCIYGCDGEDICPCCLAICDCDCHGTDFHSTQCVCEACIQNHPEREILLGIDEEWHGDEPPKGDQEG